MRPQTNPAFRGCWSNVAVGTSAADFEKMQRRTGGLFFAGEATDYDFNGFVAGGFSSGDNVAKLVEAELRRSPLAGPQGRGVDDPRA